MKLSQTIPQLSREEKELQTRDDMYAGLNCTDTELDRVKEDVKKAIMKRYPECVSAAIGVRVGDILCNNVDIPLVIVHEGNAVHINGNDNCFLDNFYIIGNAL